MARRYPVRSRQIRRYGPAPRINVGPTINHGGKTITNYLQRRRLRNEARLHAQSEERFREVDNGKVRFVSKNEHEINQKMKADRIDQERQQVVRDLEKQRLNREKLKNERHELAERMKSRVATKQTWQGGQMTEQDKRLNKEIHQEKKEHPWAGTKGAERIVADHEHTNIAEVREAYVTG